MPEPGIIKEPVHLGLVETKDPSVLEVGEVSRADDCYYKPNDGRLWKVPGRSAYNQVAEATGISGAVYAQFDGVTEDRFVTLVGSTYRVGPAGKGGEFEDLVTGLSPGAKNVVGIHFRNEWFLFNGIDRNRWFKTTDAAGGSVNPPDSTSVFFHGMLDETAVPTLDSAGGAGAGFVLTTDSTVTYWFEERVKVGSLVIKRNGATSNETVTLTGTGVNVKPLLTHIRINSDATHLALFGTATNGAFPAGAEISEVAITASTSIEDTRETNDPLIPGGLTYELFTAGIFGAVIATTRNGAPPIASVGALYNNSLVLNDIDNPTYIRYSWPNTPHSFPPLNIIEFPTGENDLVTVILRMGSVIMVGLRDSLWRVNILPRPEDASFDTTRVKDQIEGAFGVVGSKAATIFSFGEGPRMAYVSPAGLVVATETNWDVLSDDILFNEDTVEFSKLEDSVLIDNPQFYRLEWHFTPKGGSHNSKAYYFVYHPSHLKQSDRGIRLKATGPINVEAKAAMRALLGGERKIFTASGGKLWLEGGSRNDESDAGGIQMNVKTRDIFPFDAGHHALLSTLWTHHSAAPGQEATITATERNEGVNDADRTGEIALDRREHTQADITAEAEAFRFGFANSDDLGEVSLDYFFALVEDLDLSEEA